MTSTVRRTSSVLFRTVHVWGLVQSTGGASEASAGVPVPTDAFVVVRSGFHVQVAWVVERASSVEEYHSMTSISA